MNERRNRADLIEVFKIVKGLSGVPLESMFGLSTNKQLRGHEFKLAKHRTNLNVRRHFFTERLVNRWNSLSQYTVKADTVNSFKRELQRMRQHRMGFFED